MKKKKIMFKVLFESKKAVGIEFSKLKKTFKAFATKGVILSAGTIGTPQILMLSGIGPKKHLEELKVTRIMNKVSKIHKPFQQLILY